MIASQIGKDSCISSLVLGIPGEKPATFSEDGYGNVYLNNISFSGPKSAVTKEKNPADLFKRLVTCPAGAARLGPGGQHPESGAGRAGELRAQRDGVGQGRGGEAAEVRGPGRSPAHAGVLQLDLRAGAEVPHAHWAARAWPHPGPRRRRQRQLRDAQPRDRRSRHHAEGRLHGDVRPAGDRLQVQPHQGEQPDAGRRVLPPQLRRPGHHRQLHPRPVARGDQRQGGRPPALGVDHHPLLRADRPAAAADGRGQRGQRHHCWTTPSSTSAANTATATPTSSPTSR